MPAVYAASCSRKHVPEDYDRTFENDNVQAVVRPSVVAGTPSSSAQRPDVARNE
jgi:hypothetical protein